MPTPIDFDLPEYLRQYYVRDSPTADDIACFARLSEFIRRHGPFDTAIDVGCGPVVDYMFAIASWVRSITFADALPANRAMIRSWLDDIGGEPIWRPYFREILRIQGSAGNELTRREQLLRQRTEGVIACDLNRTDPLAEMRHFDLVTSFFCAECITSERSEWVAATMRLADLVKPEKGRGIVIAALGRAQFWRVGTQRLPAVSIDRDDLFRVLMECGFAADSITVEVVPTPHWVEDGFDHILIAEGVR